MSGHCDERPVTGIQLIFSGDLGSENAQHYVIRAPGHLTGRKTGQVTSAESLQVADSSREICCYDVGSSVAKGLGAIGTPVWGTTTTRKPLLSLAHFGPIALL
jgi:hypothetical protein